MRRALPLLTLLACAAPDASEATMPDPGPGPTCTSLFDFSDPGDRAAWAAQNDTVMGGNSDGTVVETDASIVFVGDLVTRGGGFVQVQAPLPEGALDGMTALRLVGTSEGRPWRARVTTDERVPRAAMRGPDVPIPNSGKGLDGPRISFAAPIEGLPQDTPGKATARFDAPDPSVRGRPVPNAAWNPGDARTLGLILADGRDAPFRLEVLRIEVCR